MRYKNDVEGSDIEALDFVLKMVASFICVTVLQDTSKIVLHTRPLVLIDVSYTSEMR